MESEKELLDTLRIFSPGTSIRMALDDLMNARMGALIAVDKEGLFNIVDGGFKVNSKFSPQKLVELAKMDGAIILSSDLKKILYSNTLLAPDVKIKTKETGTRHQAAERTAKQINTIVIAVSERKNKITIYYGDSKYILEESSEILRRATETLQILEKQKETFNDLVINLNILEINNLVTISDICMVLQRIEIIHRVSDMVKKYLVELGKEGIMVSMRLRELTKDLNKDKKDILEDYAKLRASRISIILEDMNFDKLLDTSNLPKLLFSEVHDKFVYSRGKRILSKTNLSSKHIDLILSNFKGLDEIINAEKDSLLRVLKDDKTVNSLAQDLESLREKILVGKKI